MSRKTELIVFLVLVIGSSIAVLLYSGWASWVSVRLWLIIAGVVLTVWIVGDYITARNEKARQQKVSDALKKYHEEKLKKL